MIGAIIIQRKVRSAFDCLNRRDLPTFLSNWAEAATFIYPPTVSVGGKMEGKKEVEKWFQKFMKQFPKVNFTLTSVCVRNIFAFVGSNDVAAEWNASLTNRDGEDFQISGVTFINASGGKFLWACDYIFDTTILKEAWGKGKGK
jgi:ketosteroid isomerase-like protein